MIFLLLCGHALCDFALQSEWVATNKNRHIRDHFSSDEKKSREVIWPWLLSAHALHHGLAVYLISGSVLLGVLESVSHWIIDFLKCDGWYGFQVDQAIHIGLKFVWVGLTFA